jgi:uridine kinase
MPTLLSFVKIESLRASTHGAVFLYIILAFLLRVNRPRTNFCRIPPRGLAFSPKSSYNRLNNKRFMEGLAMNTIFIGIAGGTGSGKTTLTEHLKQHFGDDISVVHHDSYYKYQDRPFEERCKQNYDHPDAFETDLMVEQLKELKAGKAIRCPVYSYADHQRTSETELIRPSKVVIVEGILIFQDPRLREMLDIKIFVETDADVRILRRALRDVRDRGRTLESVITQYLTTVKPMHEQFVEPSRKYADIIVLEGGHNLVALDMIMQRIASHIASAD